MEMWCKAMLYGPVQRLRCLPLLHRNPELQEEAPVATAEHGEDYSKATRGWTRTSTFFRRGTTLPRDPVDRVRQELGQDAPSCFASTIARRGHSLLTKEISKHTLESSLGTAARAAAQCHESNNKSTSRLEVPCLARSRSGCSCAVALVATRPEAWKVMGRRWKTAKFVQAHNELATRRGALLATITPPTRTRYSTRALQEYLRTPPASPAPRACRGAASKLLPLPSPTNLVGPH
jgi:hypothetical protein